MKRNIFKYLRKKILQYSTVTKEEDDIFYSYKIECLGFVEVISFTSDYFSKKNAEGMLIDRLVENPEFLKRLEQIENREDNLKSLLD
jgi:hypothetical protein